MGVCDLRNLQPRLDAFVTMPTEGKRLSDGTANRVLLTPTAREPMQNGEFSYRTKDKSQE